MPVIGRFMPTRDGGWLGTIRTLMIDVKVRFVPNDNRDNENAPAFRILVGTSVLGAAWAQRSNGQNPRDYFSVQIDDPSLPEPISAAMFHGNDGEDAQLVWNRRRTE